MWFAKLRKDMDSNWHIYQKGKRIWAQKPYNNNKVKPEAGIEVQNLASDSEGDKLDAKRQVVSPSSPETK